MDAGELTGRAAIVTGGGRGIGRAIVEALARAGASVVFTGRGDDLGHAAEVALVSDGHRARFARADQAVDADWPAVIAAAEALAPVRIVVLNAGVSAMARTDALTLEGFRAIFRPNLKGAFLGLRHGVEAIRRSGEGGSVIMVSSIAGHIGVADHLHYTAAKSGVCLLAKAAALELGPEQIRVNTILPGFVETEMTARFDPAQRAAAPLGRAGRPEELAATALFLASDRSAFMTGAEVVVDGGWTAR